MYISLVILSIHWPLFKKTRKKTLICIKIDHFYCNDITKIRTAEHITSIKLKSWKLRLYANVKKKMLSLFLWNNKLSNDYIVGKWVISLWNLELFLEVLNQHSKKVCFILRLYHFLLWPIDIVTTHLVWTTISVSESNTIPYHVYIVQLDLMTKYFSILLFLHF